MRVIEAQCSRSWRLTITSHIKQIRATWARSDLIGALTNSARGFASLPREGLVATACSSGASNSAPPTGLALLQCLQLWLLGRARLAGGRAWVIGCRVWLV